MILCNFWHLINTHKLEIFAFNLVPMQFPPCHVVTKLFPPFYRRNRRMVHVGWLRWLCLCSALQKGEQELWVVWSDPQVNLEGTSPKRI